MIQVNWFLSVSSIFALILLASVNADDKCQLPGFNLEPLSRSTYAVYPNNKSCKDSTKPCVLLFSVCSNSVLCPAGQQACHIQSGNASDLGSIPTFSETKDGFSVIYDRAPNASNLILEFSCDAKKKMEPLDPLSVIHLEAKDTHHLNESYRVFLAYDLACKQQGLGAGAQFMIIILVLTLVYFIGGVIYNHANGARGVELVPHHWFWTNFAGYVVDGCLFLVRVVTCQSTSNYAQNPDYGSTSAGISPTGRNYESM